MNSSLNHWFFVGLLQDRDISTDVEITVRQAGRRLRYISWNFFEKKPYYTNNLNKTTLLYCNPTPANDFQMPVILTQK